MADTTRKRSQGRSEFEEAKGCREKRNQQPAGCCECATGENWSTEPSVGRVAHGVACRVDRLKAIGNGQVPQCAAEAFRRLKERQLT